MNRTAIFTFGSLILGTGLGLFFAFALFRVVSKLRFLRAVTVAPYIISNVAAAVMFRILFNSQFGVLNQVIEWFGVDGPSWLADPALAMFVVIVTQVLSRTQAGVPPKDVAAMRPPTTCHVPRCCVQPGMTGPSG